MDSLTQFTLGAAVGEAMLGRQLGRRAALWGGLLGTLPDLDVLIPLGDAVRDFTYHRGVSHSLFVLAALTPLIVWAIRRLNVDARALTWRIGLTVYLIFATHVLLDSFTVYGTQIFWPVVLTPMTWSTIFIIDPAYTLPLAFGVLSAVIVRHHPFGHRANLVGLGLSTLYLAWTVGAKLHVHEIAKTSLAGQGIEVRQLLSTPPIFASCALLAEVL